MTDEHRAAFASIAERLGRLSRELASVIETMPAETRGPLCWIMYALGCVVAELQLWSEGKRP